MTFEVPIATAGMNSWPIEASLIVAGFENVAPPSVEITDSMALFAPTCAE